MKKQFVKLLNYTLWLGFAIFLIRCYFARESLKSNVSIYDLLSYAGEAVSLAIIISAFYEKWLWRFNFLEDTPVLNKKYKGFLVSTRDNVQREFFLEIKQSLLTISVIFTTDESKSKSIVASIDEIFGEKQLTYCFLNTPNAKVRNRSEMHYGTAMLCVEDVNKLTGQYFSDRKTTGDLIFTPIINDSNKSIKHIDK